MKRIEVTRRQVLRGAGGFALGLPLLPSLLPGRALGDPLITRPRRFVAFMNFHGAAMVKNMYPPKAMLTNKGDLFPGHQIAWGRLARSVQGGNAVLSPILTAPSGVLTDRLIAKMNVIRGFGTPFDWIHGTGHYLGNFASNGGVSADGVHLQRVTPWPTIDQVMAWSPSFYKDLGGVRVRSIVGTTWYANFGYSNPSSRTGNVVEVKQTAATTLALFDKLFGGAAPAAPTRPARQPIIDKVITSYRALRDGSRRLSAADRQRLDDHVARLAELERALTVTGKPLGCGMRPVGSPAGLDVYALDRGVTPARSFQLLNDVIAAAFTCGATRIATVMAQGCFELPSPLWQDWHADVAHMFDQPAKQAVIVSSYRRVFSDMLVDLAAKLDVEEAPGSTYLDNSLLTWTQEGGDQVHNAMQIPIITFGSGGGSLRTGNYLDFRNRAPSSTVCPGPFCRPTNDGYAPYYESLGLTWHQWLAIQLQAMGIPRAEFERDGNHGYGYPYIGPGYRNKFVSGALTNLSDIPPPLAA